MEQEFSASKENRDCGSSWRQKPLEGATRPPSFSTECDQLQRPGYEKLGAPKAFVDAVMRKSENITAKTFDSGETLEVQEGV